MNSKRSTYNPLNQGRRRRPSTSISELNRTLDELEGRYERESRRALPDTDIQRRMESLSRGVSRASLRAEPARREVDPRPQPASRHREQDLRSVARDIERLRAQEDAMATSSRIASELAALREDLKTQVNSGLRSQFNQLKMELEEVIERAQENGRSGAFIAELERLSEAVAAHGPRGDERSINMLRLEIEQLRTAMDALAKEQTVRSVDERWSQMDRRFEEFEARFDQAPASPDSRALDTLAERMDQIGRAVASMPGSGAIRALEERMRGLTDTVAEHAARQDMVTSDTLAMMEARLDEISQAIVAATAAAQSPNIDPEPFERIEARISALARQIDEVTETAERSDVFDQVHILSDKVDQIAARVEVPEQIIEHLAGQLDIISRKLDADAARPGAEEILDGFETRFTALSEILDRRQTEVLERSNTLFRDLDSRLNQVAERLDRRDEEVPAAEAELITVIDAKFAEITKRLERAEASEDAIVHGLERRLDEIAESLQASNASIAQVDGDIVRNLERQVAALSRQLAEPSREMPEFDDIAPRLDQIERSIEENREAVIEAARRVAEDAVRALPVTDGDAIAVTGLAGDLRSLETLTRKADERNTKTFEAIHDTLLKIVDRLGSLESGQAQPTPRHAVGAPALDPGQDMELAVEPAPVRPAAKPTAGRSPAQAAAAAAAVEAMGKKADAVQDSKRSLLGGLGRALFKEREKSEKKKAPLAGPVADADGRIDPKLANQPLEPGSGGPDLNAIMRRVRDETAPRNQRDADAAKADFIAAARRAAQAAAAEAETLKKRGGDAKGGGGLGLAGIARSKSKPVMLAAAAILVAIAGMQLSSAFFGGSGSEPSYTAEYAGGDALPSGEDGKDADEFAGLEDETEQDVAAADVPVEEEPVEGATPDVRMAGMMAPAPAAPAAPVAPVTQAAIPPASAPAAAPEIPVEAGPVALREAAAANDPKALFEIGSRYAEGRGVPTDMKTAAVWYEQAAERGLAPAQYRIGNFFEKGTGVSRDIPKAKAWYEKAARQGNASAMHNLAVLYAMGADGVTDNEKAAKWFTDAAELGVKDSQFNLGILAAKGVGMPQNLEESYKWFALVAQTGDRDAEAKREEIANALRPDQLERAKGATQLWKARQPVSEANEVMIPNEWTESPTTTASVDMEKAILNIQAILNKNGYDAGKPDGVMGQKTRNAIAKFQADNGMPSTGEVNEPLVRALLARK